MTDAEKHDKNMRLVRDSGLLEVGVRLRVLDIVWNMRDRATECDRTGSGKMFYGEIHVPISTDTLRAFADELEEAAMLGLPNELSKRRPESESDAAQ